MSAQIELKYELHRQSPRAPVVPEAQPALLEVSDVSSFTSRSQTDLESEEEILPGEGDWGEYQYRDIQLGYQVEQLP